MKKLIGSLTIGVLLAGCANNPPGIRSDDNFLMQAGFTRLDRSSPAFATAVHMLPPHMFGHRTSNGTTSYYYFDPTICGCVYTGTAADWATYRQLVADKMHMDADQFLEKVDMPADTGSG